jgi:hypothetical protein
MSSARTRPAGLHRSVASQTRQNNIAAAPELAKQRKDEKRQKKYKKKNLKSNIDKHKHVKKQDDFLRSYYTPQEYNERLWKGWNDEWKTHLRVNANILKGSGAYKKARMRHVRDALGDMEYDVLHELDKKGDWYGTKL